MSAGANTPIYTLPLPTADGVFLARYSAAGLCQLNFPSRANLPETSHRLAAPPAQIRRWHAATQRALAEALAGRLPRHLPPLDLSSGTDFQQRVWRALCRIAGGNTCSYAEVARAIGRPKAARAVGAACGANPIPVFVPCHRVLAAKHRLGGFSAGLDWKRLLLCREGTSPG